MSINWFPGHMVAAVEAAKKAMALNDVVIEVLDARCPLASSNPSINGLRAARQRPALKVINKVDAADPLATAAWLDYFNNQPNTKAIGISCKKPGDANKVLEAARVLAPTRNSMIKPMRMMVMGIPNVGKSTLINALMKKRTAKVGDEPAVTKLVKRYDLSNSVFLTDTPGLMWPKIEDVNAGLMLAASHAIGTNAYIDYEVASFLADILLRRYSGALISRYEFAKDSIAGLDGFGVIEAIAQKRGFLMKARKGVAVGELDIDKAAKTLLVDYRTGHLGRVTLERP